eukprot:TRINITY_DN337_c0_g1_i2.p5 TRINITY_DN337_c0_g1~~TRINITY_DN337_c0_g1_i2.p5  ORF type:complete len:102 (+),score=0.66 TRINITY_DN337_c0_g1_i2:370-675(+)
MNSAYYTKFQKGLNLFSVKQIKLKEFRNNIINDYNLAILQRNELRKKINNEQFSEFYTFQNNNLVKFCISNTSILQIFTYRNNNNITAIKIDYRLFEKRMS